MKKITCIGGGSGTSNLLRELRQRDGVDIAAIISTSDSGGSTGVIRKQYDEVALGDIRQNLFALASDESMKTLFDHRFDRGFMEGHAFGNIYLLGLKQQLGSLTKAIDHIRKVYDIQGDIIPITEDKHDIHITLRDGTQLEDEVSVLKCDQLVGNIASIGLSPLPQACPKALDRIHDSDIIVIGPGCLYTSLIAPLLTEGVIPSIKASSAKKVLIGNLANFPKGHMDGFALSDYVAEFARYWGEDIFDHIIAHDGGLPDGYEAVVCDIDDPRLIRGDFLSEKTKDIHHDTLMGMGRSKIYHDASKIVNILLDLHS